MFWALPLPNLSKHRSSSWSILREVRNFLFRWRHFLTSFGWGWWWWKGFCQDIEVKGFLEDGLVPSSTGWLSLPSMTHPGSRGRVNLFEPSWEGFPTLHNLSPTMIHVPQVSSSYAPEVSLLHSAGTKVSPKPSDPLYSSLPSPSFSNICPFYPVSIPLVSLEEIVSRDRGGGLSPFLDECPIAQSRCNVSTFLVTWTTS